MSTTPRIYVACLSSYNAGELHGVWVDAVDADAIQTAVDAMLAKSKHEPHEEWAIHDFEGFKGATLTEFHDFGDVAEIGACIKEHGEVFAQLLEHHGMDVDRALEVMKEDYHGAWDSLEEYAESYMDDTGMLQGLPENLRCYFDYEKFARDMELGGDVFTVETSDGKTHVFSNH
jgi:antirestriction protein